MSQKERMHELLYSNDDRVELCERICNLEAESAKLRQMVARMWPMATGTKRCTFADRLKLRAEIDELGIEVSE